MPVTSWKAFALVAGAWIISASPCLAQAVAPAQAVEPASKTDKPKADAAPNPDDSKVEKPEEAGAAKSRSIELKLVIAGLGADGCDVEVKPGNAGCVFKAQTRHVASNGKASLVFKDVELRGADRNCTFAVIVRENGQPPKTIYRGFRIPSETAAAARPGALSFTCFMSSASRIADIQSETRTRR